MDNTCVYLLFLIPSLMSGAKATSPSGDISNPEIRQLHREVTQLQRKMVQLQAENQAQKVAFAATLVNSGEKTIGPNADELTLVYTHVTANIGNAYNADTGIFTAPVKGIYHFQIYALSNTGTAAVYLKKNGVGVCQAHERQASGDFTAANAATLSLEVGDTVYVTLPSSRVVYDNQHHHNTFCGHLLFTL